jgi:hypothetical protein
MESLIIIVAPVLINDNWNIYTSAIFLKAVARLLPLILILSLRSFLHVEGRIHTYAVGMFL